VIDGARHALEKVLAPSGLAHSPHAVTVRAADGSGAETSRGLSSRTTLGVDAAMYAASIAKQVIGMLAALEADAGTLAPEQKVAAHIDGLPTWAGGVRIRHLIHHTSGLPDVPRHDLEEGNAEVLSHLHAESGLLAEPGTTYRYCNVGYICLAEVIRRTSGRHVPELARATLFAPFTMPSARLGGPMPEALVGHQRPPQTVGDGGLWLSARDLGRWNDAMNAQALGSAVHLLAEQPGTLDDATAIDYAWGIRVVDHAGQRTISHGGSWPTWSAKTIRQPDVGVSVAILAATDDTKTVSDVALALAHGLGGQPA
jgi:CubicO group peptidase (beta-lactamase class C family)